MDLIVVGAGIIGLACAFEAAEAGLRVCVLDEAGVATGPTGVAAGMLAPLAEAHDMPEDLLRHSVQSALAWPDFAARIERYGGDCHFLASGTLILAADRDQAGELGQLARAHERLGLHVQPLTVREVLRQEPRLSPRIAGALRCDQDHAVEPIAACHALVHALQALGSTVRAGQVASVLHEQAVQGVVLTDGTTLHAPRVLLAAGLRTTALLAPFHDLPLRPVKGQVLHLKGESLIRGVVRSTRAYLVPRGDRLVVGASEEEVGLHDKPLAGITMDLLYEAWRILPGVYELELERILVGHRPSPRDGRPLVDAVGPDGLFVATGHHRHGILLAPWTAARMRSLLG